MVFLFFFCVLARLVFQVSVHSAVLTVTSSWISSYGWVLDAEEMLVVWSPKKWNLAIVWYFLPPKPLEPVFFGGKKSEADWLEVRKNEKPPSKVKTDPLCWGMKRLTLWLTHSHQAKVLYTQNLMFIRGPRRSDLKNPGRENRPCPSPGVLEKPDAFCLLRLYGLTGLMAQLDRNGMSWGIGPICWGFPYVFLRLSFSSLCLCVCMCRNGLWMVAGSCSNAVRLFASFFGNMVT